MRLLIAEDEKDLAEALTVFFEKNNFSADAVYDGQDAYDYAISGGYDAIILDIMMPKMNGIEVLEKLRRPRKKACQTARKTDRLTPKRPIRRDFSFCGATKTGTSFRQISTR